MKKLKTSSQNGLSLEEISADGGEFEVTSKYTSLNDILSIEDFFVDQGENEVTKKEEPFQSDLAKEIIFTNEEVAPETGVQLNGESSSGNGKGNAKWVNTFDLNERPQDDEDADENN
ncbi:hypothetical protein QL285_092818 [Trifolium repens]|nr:hypothetical protein QL285_092818 [Trifolium repens]